MISSFRNTCFLALAGVSLLGCEQSHEAGVEWGDLRNLGSLINSSARDEHITLIEDSSVMFFASDREDGVGGYDLYTSRNTEGEWSRAEPLPYPVNTDRDEYDPFVTLDGSMLFFASNRGNDGPYWDADIYLTEWDGWEWSQPRIYDSLFVAPGVPDWGVAIPRGFHTFIFSSGRPPAETGMVQIFMSEWLGEEWSEPLILPTPVNSGGWEATPYVTPDGKTLYLNSGRGEPEKEDVDIWRFEYIDGIWSDPHRMEGPFLSPAHDYDPCLSPDGSMFYFTSDREGGIGSSDIYVVERIGKGKRY